MTDKPKKARDWQQQLRFDVEWAKRLLLDKGEVRAMAILHAPDQIKIILMDMDPARKGAMQALLTLTAIADDAYGCVMISEAWMSTATVEDEADPMHPRVMPRDREDRTEVLILWAAYRENDERHEHCTMLEILRGANGKPSGTKPIEAKGKGFSPWFDVITPVRPIPPMREKAREMLAELMPLFAHDVHVTHPPGRA